MSIIESYQKEINKYQVMSEVCIKLLEFKNERDTEFQKYKIRKLQDEIINHSNYNRISRIVKEIDKAKEFHDGSKTWNTALKEVGLDPNDSEYTAHIEKLKNFGPKKYLKECLSKIINYKDLIKNERKAQKEHSKNHDRKYKGVRPAVINSMTIRNKETLDEIIKKHIREKNVYVEDKEISDIKDQFGLSLYNEKNGYLSEDTIDKLFSLRIVNEILDRHEELTTQSIINTMDSLFDLAITEMEYRKNNYSYGKRAALNYEIALDEIKKTYRDYVEEYTSLYKKVINYCNKLSNEERLELKERIKTAKHIGDNGYLINPEVFRARVNDKSKEKMHNWKAYTEINIDDVVDELSNYTKYMKAEELADYYHTIESEERDIDRKKLQEIFTRLIEKKMGPINSNQIEEQKKRLKAACRDYLKEEPLFMDSTNIIVETDYATTRVESRRAIKESEKKYFRMSKFRQAIKFMDFNKLSRLNNKEVLNEEELQRVKGMF